MSPFLAVPAYGCPSPPPVTLHLLGYENKVRAIHSLRQVTGCTMQDALVVLNSLPYCIFGPTEDFDPDLQDRIIAFKSGGWVVETRPA